MKKNFEQKGNFLEMTKFCPNKNFHLGETLIYCSTGPTDPVFARKKKNNNMDSPIGYS